jgi:hypothetical protein
MFPANPWSAITAGPEPVTLTLRLTPFTSM